MKKRTLFEKVWDEHIVCPETEQTPAVLYIDLHLIHEVTSPQAFTQLSELRLGVRRPERVIATMDHSTPTDAPAPGGRRVVRDSQAAAQLRQLQINCDKHKILLHDLDHPQQGIIHVIAPEIGYTQPGMTIVCGDSHTSTHGAFGALAFGIGTSEVAHVLATQCLLQRRPKTFAIHVNGRLPRGVTSKDLILSIIAKIGVGGATGHVIEYRGSTIDALSMEERMTVCNMSIEAGARAGMIAPDETTFAYLADRPASVDRQKASERWHDLRSDEGAAYDRELTFDASDLEPMITFGTNPEMAIPIRAPIPKPNDNVSVQKALQYMGLSSGRSLLGQAIDVVFIGSCTNGRLLDLRHAASVVKGRKVAPGVRMFVVPGSQTVKKQAEAEGLDHVFRQAGAEWREPGCSMCIAMNGDHLEPGAYCVSTSNRNFEGRQGAGGRTFLASPLTAAASAIRGTITDVRELMGAP